MEQALAINDLDLRVKSLLAKQRALANLTLEMTRQVELQVQPVFEAALAQAGEALGAGMACLHLADDQQGVTRLVANWQLPASQARHWGQLPLAGDSGPARCQQSGQPVEMGPGLGASGLGGLACAPVKGMDLVLGTISILYQTPLPPDPDRADFLESVGYLLGLAIEHAGLISEMVDNLDQLMQLKANLEARNQELDQANQQLAQLSVTDGLTGVFNHRHLHERLAGEIARSRRLGHPVCLVMADLDFFKRINDRLGHPVGDEALRLAAGLLSSGVREVDVVGRYGGEEFLLILVDCHLQAGRLVADKLRQSIAQGSERPPFDSLGGFTVSMGVAQLQEGMDETGSDRRRRPGPLPGQARGAQPRGHRRLAG